MTLAVYDHVGGHLEGIAVECGFEPVPTTKSGDAKDFEARDVLSQDLAWKIALVHINAPECWEALCHAAGPTQVLVRFSRERLPPRAPDSGRALCISCIREIAELKAGDIEILKQSLCAPEIVAMLRARQIPRGLLHLFAFEEPHCLRALRTVMLGVMAAWASDPINDNSVSARALLGLTATPPPAALDMTNMSTLRKLLSIKEERNDRQRSADAFRCSMAREMGLAELPANKDTKDGRIGLLLNEIFWTDGAMSPDPHLVLEAIKALQGVLGLNNPRQWNRTRLDFNHMWLKNRLIVALSRAKRVLDGSVQDEHIWGDLLTLFSEWPQRKENAQWVLEQFTEAIHSVDRVENPLGGHVESDTKVWLLDIAHQYWAHVEQPELRSSDARTALARLDEKIGLATGLLRSRSRSIDVAQLDELQSASSQLSEAFSDLVSPGISVG